MRRRLMVGSSAWLGLVTVVLAQPPPVDTAAPEAGSDIRAPLTWRLDFFQTGDAASEVLSFDRVVVEPLEWPSPPGGEAEPSDLGVYRSKVLGGDGRVLHSRGFSPIFAEWQSTAEASQMRRTFHESVRFPQPETAVEVVIERRDGQGRFQEIWRIGVDPQDPRVDRRPPAPQTVLEIEVHGAPAARVDLLLIGDGYTTDECATRFEADARRLTEALFRREPFAARRRDWNVRGICPPSAQSGVSRPSTGTQRRSPLGSSFDIFGSERYLLTFDDRALREIAAWAPYELVVILANADTYGGGGLFNRHAVVSMGSAFADYVFVHELGHHFAGLADEYYTSPVAYQPPAEVVEPWEPNVTALLDPTQLKWSDLASAGVAIPTPWPKETFEDYARGFQTRRQEIRAEGLPESAMDDHFRTQQMIETALLAASENAGKIGAFKGANYDTEAFYRPQIDCVMFTRDDVPFCAVCERALEAVIDRYAPP